jgi:hypothetical protein
MATRAAAVAALTLLAAAPGATIAAENEGSDSRAPIAKQVRLKSFGSCGALVRYGRRHVRRGVGVAPPISFPEPLVGPQPRGMPGSTPDSPGAEGAPGDSGTNVQETGVDEPDLVKATSELIFVVAANRLHAVKADGLERLDTLELEGWGHQLLLAGDRLLMISQATPYGDVPIGPADVAVGLPDTVTQLTEIDVSDPTAMRVVATERIRGEHLGSRLTGDTARVVLWSRPRAVLQPAFRAQLRGWLPRRVLRRSSGGGPQFRPAARCRRVLRPAAHSGVDLLTVLTIDMSRGLPAVDSDAVMGGGQTVYASKRALYVGLQQGEDRTQLHKFGAAGAGETTYLASGRVGGSLLNQFSMSEREGVLRVATTRSAESESSVITLVQRDGALVQLGRVDGLGKGERIYAVRFLGDAGYVVTFRQVDPLYTLDLSRPATPRVVGELKIPGYSAYLHPAGEDLLIGVGQDATPEGRQLGTQVSLFDISNLASPTRLHQRKLAASGSSEAEWDHHAFLWWAPAKLAVIPLEYWSGDGAGVFAGAVGLTIDRAAGIAEAGRATHEGPDWPAVVRRSLIVGGRLVTISDAGIEQNGLSDLAEQDRLAFPGP